MISGRQKPVPREIIGLLSLVVALPTSAEPIIIEFGGVIDFVEEGLPIADQVALGMPYYALYQFDPVGVDDVNDSPTSGNYPFGSAGFMSADIGALTFVTADLRISINNLPQLDRYGVGSMTPFVANSVSWEGMALDLRDDTHTAFDSDELPLDAPNLDDFQFSRSFFLLQPNRRDPSITGTVDFLTMIPEPSSMAILLTGVALVAGRRRHSSSKSMSVRSG